MPGFLADFFSWVRSVQVMFNRMLTEQVALFRDEHSLVTALALMSFAFLYGVFHAAGPGHGKFVIGSYFIANGTRVGRGVLAASAIALTQAISAIVLVSIVGGLFQVGRFVLLENARMLEVVSYTLIMMLGLAMTVQALRRPHACCDHDHHSAAVTTNRDRGLLPMALAVGLRPCSGAIILLIFAFANSLYLIGISAVFAMAVGVAITTSAVGLISIGVRSGALMALDRRRTAALAISRVMHVAGAMLIAMIGALFLMAAVS